MDDLVAQFADLFEGRKDAYGTEEGGCWRPPERFRWPAAVSRHLKGDEPIGVYPLVERKGGYIPNPVREDGTSSLVLRTSPSTWVVKWGCVDFDEGEDESWTHAVNVTNVLVQFDITGWIERSRSKGYHVWVFADTWVPAETMRYALLAACQIVDAPTKEINPKQIVLEGDGVGNYVRLPYPGILNRPLASASPFRRIMVPQDGSYPYIGFEPFIGDAIASRCTVDQLQPLADLYTPPKRIEPKTFTDVDTQLHWQHRTGGLAATLIEGTGPRDYQDRSGWLYVIARACAEHGKMTRDEIVEAVTLADQRHTRKFVDRDDGVLRLQQLVDAALEG